MNAIDLNKGEIAWQVPLGEEPALVKRGRRHTGTENYGGPIITAGGLIFIGATKDEKFRALDKRTGAGAVGSRSCRPAGTRRQARTSSTASNTS